MMKRILALVLVIASLALALTGCAYRYDKKDMTKYAKADYAKLDALLANLEIEDSDFGRFIANDNGRDGKVLEEIDSILAEKLDAQIKDGSAAKLTEGKYGFGQKIYYAYYCSVEIDGVTYYFNTDKMNDASLSTLLSTQKYDGETKKGELILSAEELVAIFEAMQALPDNSIKSYAYDSETTGTLAKDELVFVSYTYTKAGETATVSTKYLPVIVGAASGVGALLEGKSIGSIEISTTEPLKFTDEAGVECTLSSLKVDYRAKGNSFTVEHTTYTADKKVAHAANTATDATINLKDKAITYYVYPAYAYALAELSAETVVDVIFGDGISSSSLPCFADDEDLKKIVDDIKDLKDTYDQLNSKATASGATQSQKDDAKEAKAELDAALETLYEDLIEKDSAVGGTILEEYKEKIYEQLEAEYDADIRTKLAAAIWAWAEKNIEVDLENLPKSAVKEAREQILAVHKNTYYTGKDSNSKAYVDQYSTFKEYLAGGVTEYKGKVVDDEIDKQAREDVAEIVRVYAIAQHYEEHVDRVTNADVSLYLDELYPQLYYNFYLSGNYSPTVEDVRDLYGDTALRASLTFDRVMDYFLATEEKDGHITYKNVTISYK